MVDMQEDGSLLQLNSDKLTFMEVKNRFILHDIAARNRYDLAVFALKGFSVSERVKLLQSPDDSEMTPYMYAARNDSTECMKAMINMVGFDDNLKLLKLKDGYESTAIHLAALEGRSQFLCILKSYFKNKLAKWSELLAIKDEDNSTAIHYAVEKGHVAIVLDMLHSLSSQQSYDVVKTQRSTVDSRTALQLAVESRNIECVNVILASVPELSLAYDLLALRDTCGETAIYLAIANKDDACFQAIVKVLHKIPENLNEFFCMKSAAGDTALHCASLHNYRLAVESIMESLTVVQQTALLNSNNERGQTPTEVAIAANNSEMVQLLRTYRSQRSEEDSKLESEKSTAFNTKLAFAYLKLSDELSKKEEENKNLQKRNQELYVSKVGGIDQTADCDGDVLIETVTRFVKNMQTKLQAADEKKAGKSKKEGNVENLELKVQQLQAVGEMRRRELLDAKENLKNVSVENEQWSKERIELRSENASLKLKVDKYEAKYAKLQDERDELQNELTRQKEAHIHEMRIAESSKQQHKQRAEQLEKENDRLKEKSVVKSTARRKWKDEGTHHQPSAQAPDVASTDIEMDDPMVTTTTLVDELGVTKGVPAVKTKTSGAIKKEESSQASTSDDGSDFEEEHMPTGLIKDIARICVERGVQKHILLPNPQNQKNIAVLGINTKNLTEEDFLALSEKYDGYTIFAPKHSGRVHTKQLIWRNALKMERFGLEKNGTCELILKAKPLGTDEEVFYAVGPAHMMFTKRKNRQLMDRCNITELRDFVRKEPPKRVYKFRSGRHAEGASNEREEEGECLMVPTHHPPLIGYRYFYEPDIADPNQGIADDDTMQPSGESPILKAKYCLNDMVLLRFTQESAVNIQRRLSNYRITRQESLVRVRSLGRLKKFIIPERPNQPPITIVVKNFKGRLRNNQATKDQRNQFMGHHLLFTLDAGELTNSDSGSIVYKERQNGRHYPLGMLVGVMNPIFPGAPPYYQALILDQAFKDLQEDYGDVLATIDLYKIPTEEEDTDSDDLAANDDDDDVVLDDDVPVGRL